MREQWQQGMASSMQAGLSALLSMHPHLTSVLFILCDQPFVSAALLKEMIAKRNDMSKGIAACEYKRIVGVPALFTRTYFDVLLSLRGAEGGKRIITEHMNDVAIISFPPGAVDIDTPEDYRRLIN